MDAPKNQNPILAEALNLYKLDKKAFDALAKKEFKKSASYTLHSESRVYAQALELLAKSHGELKKSLTENHKQRAAHRKSLSRDRDVPRVYARHSRFGKTETEEERMQRLLPKLGPSTIKLGLSPSQLRQLNLRTLGFTDLWNACVQPVTVPHYDPRWAEGAIGQGTWMTWANHSGNQLEFFAYTCGDGSSDQDYSTHGGRYEWYFIAEQEETLHAWINFDMKGPCAYRRNGGDLSLWILPEITVLEGWPGMVNMTEIYHYDRWINLWLATYDGPFIDGDIPQGTIDLDFYPTPEQMVPFTTHIGQLYMIKVDVQVALITTHDACMTLGSWTGSWPPNIATCDMQGDCVLCRCY